MEALMSQFLDLYTLLTLENAQPFEALMLSGRRGYRGLGILFRYSSDLQDGG